MGRQLRFFMDYESFLTVAQAALDMGLVILPGQLPESGEIIQSRDISAVSPGICDYYFHVPEAGELKIDGNISKKVLHLSGNNVIEAGYSHILTEKKTISGARLYSVTGEYDEAGSLLPRPECTTKAYNALCRAVKKAAPRTDFRAADAMFTQKWGKRCVCGRREYISPLCRKLAEDEEYDLYI